MLSFMIMGKLPRYDSSRYQITHLWEIHKEIIRRLVAGQKPKQIADELNVTPAMISYVRNSNIVKVRMEQLSEERDFAFTQVGKQIEQLAPRALEILEEAMENPDSPINTKVKIAESLLDRAGFAPVQKFSGNVSHAHFSSEEIEEIKRRALANSQNIVVDVDSRDVSKKELPDASGSA